MEKVKDTIIPFGTRDSELNGWEYAIPDNMTAEIKDGKIIVKHKESDDESIRREIEEFLRLNAVSDDDYEKVESWCYWLKSLRPQPHWKPSEEQMKYLQIAGNTFRAFDDRHKILFSLYDDLQKLL